jgi:hypothetical protein
LDEVLNELGFDLTEHEKIQDDYRKGVIGLEQNRLPLDTKLENVLPEDVIIADHAITPDIYARGMEELHKGTVGVVSLAAGVGYVVITLRMIRLSSRKHHTKYF